MTEDKIKAEKPIDIIIQILGEDYPDITTDMIKNQEIVERLQNSIKAIESLADKDTMYEANSKRLRLVLPYLQSILDPQEVNK